MKIFNKREFVEFVRGNEYLYIDNDRDDSFENDMNVVNEVFDGNGIYSLMFGSRGEVEFVKVNNFVEDIIEWNSVSNDENEFRCINEGVDDYLDLNWEEELGCSYFIIVEVK
jgi:archaellum component FlaC